MLSYVSYIVCLILSAIWVLTHCVLNSSNFCCGGTTCSEVELMGFLSSYCCMLCSVLSFWKLLFYY